MFTPIVFSWKWNLISGRVVIIKELYVRSGDVFNWYCQLYCFSVGLFPPPSKKCHSQNWPIWPMLIYYFTTKTSANSNSDSCWLAVINILNQAHDWDGYFLSKGKSFINWTKETYDFFSRCILVSFDFQNIFKWCNL